MDLGWKIVIYTLGILSAFGWCCFHIDRLLKYRNNKNKNNNNNNLEYEELTKV